MITTRKTNRGNYVGLLNGHSVGEFPDELNAIRAANRKKDETAFLKQLKEREAK